MTYFFKTAFEEKSSIAASARCELQVRQHADMLNTHASCKCCLVVLIELSMVRWAAGRPLPRPCKSGCELMLTIL